MEFSNKGNILYIFLHLVKASHQIINEYLKKLLYFMVNLFYDMTKPLQLICTIIDAYIEQM